MSTLNVERSSRYFPWYFPWATFLRNLRFGYKTIINPWSTFRESNESRIYSARGIERVSRWQNERAGLPGRTSPQRSLLGRSFLLVLVILGKPLSLHRNCVHNDSMHTATSRHEGASLFACAWTQNRQYSAGFANALPTYYVPIVLGLKV